MFWLQDLDLFIQKGILHSFRFQFHVVASLSQLLQNGFQTLEIYNQYLVMQYRLQNHMEQFSISLAPQFGAVTNIDKDNKWE